VKQGIQFYTDAAFIERAASPLIKNAAGDLLSSLTSTVSSYVKSKMEDPDKDKFTVITDFIVPGLAWGFDLPWLAILIKISESFFDLSPGKILETAWNTLKPQAQNGPLTPNQVDDHVQSAMGGLGSESSMLSYKLVALGVANQPITVFASAKGINASLMGKIVSWVLKAGLAAAGIMVAGDIFNKITGHEDAKPTAPITTQTILKPSPAYTPEHYNQNAIWMESTPPSNIGSLITQWATSIYPDLKGHEELITSSPVFNRLVSLIQDRNKTNATAFTFIPSEFSSKRDVVDVFIDSVAQAFQASQPKSTTPPSPHKPA
jgi:hypothetical protein